MAWTVEEEEDFIEQTCVPMIRRLRAENPSWTMEAIYASVVANAASALGPASPEAYQNLRDVFVRAWKRAILKQI